MAIPSKCDKLSFWALFSWISRSSIPATHFTSGLDETKRNPGILPKFYELIEKFEIFLTGLK